MHAVPAGRPSASAALALAATLMLAACGEPEALPAGFREVPGGDAARGERLLAQYQCGSCHRIPGVPDADGRIGPSLQAFGRRSYIAGEVPSGPSSLTRWLRDPQALVPGTPMPDMGVGAVDARDMAAYLLALP